MSILVFLILCKKTRLIGGFFCLFDGGNGKEFSEETRKKISEANKGKMIGDKNPFYGRKHSDETKKKLVKQIKVNKNCITGRSKSSYGFIWKLKN